LVAYLTRHDITAPIRYVTQAVALGEQDETTVFGESLPSGILLKSEPASSPG
jgi:hypothetical protein